MLINFDHVPPQKEDAVVCSFNYHIRRHTIYLIPVLSNNLKPEHRLITRLDSDL